MAAWELCLHHISMHEGNGKPLRVLGFVGLFRGHTLKHNTIELCCKIYDHIIYVYETNTKSLMNKLIIILFTIT